METPKTEENSDKTEPNDENGSLSTNEWIAISGVTVLYVAVINGIKNTGRVEGGNKAIGWTYVYAGAAGTLGNSSPSTLNYWLGGTLSLAAYNFTILENPDIPRSKVVHDNLVIFNLLIASAIAQGVYNTYFSGNDEETKISPYWTNEKVGLSVSLKF